MKRLLVMSFVAAASAILVLAVLNLASRTPAQAAGTVGTGSPGSCTEDALHKALAGGGTVTFNCGGPATILILHQQTITQSTRILGGGIITITGGLATRLFQVANTASFTLNDITLDAGFSTAADVPPGGGAIENEGFLTLNNVILQNNQAGPGLCGGALFVNGIVDISNSTFSKNSADFAGGAICTGNNPPTPTSLSISNSGFNGNKTVSTGPGVGKGGAIFAQKNTNLTVVNGGFDSNTAQYGGAINVDQGVVATLSATSGPGGVSFFSNSATQEGGAIWNQGGLTINGGTFNFNKVPYLTLGYGAGIANYGGLTLNDCSFVFNEGRNGAGVFVGVNGSAVIRRTLFNLGKANFGGGLYAIDTNSFISIYDSVFSENGAAYGGGIARLNAHMTISNTSFTDNGANNGGGGLYLIHAPEMTQDPGYVFLTNVTIATGTSTTEQGGGLYNDGISQLTNVTFKDNLNNIYNIGLSQLNIFNSVLDNLNSLGQPNCAGGTPLALGGHNLSTDNSCAVETNNTPAQLDARKINLDGVNQTFYYPPLPGSPLIDHATNCSPTDQIGALRVGACDIGAIEFGGLVPRLYLPTVFKNGAF